ncbi:MAG: FKBP-type peptidyl-prolyl cis-trans isomerase [Polyangia bacterium]
MTDPDPTPTQLASGLCFVDIRLGTGFRAEAGDRCMVHYSGWVRGSEAPFESSRAKAEPFVFRLRKGEVIDGWIEGVAGMCVGGARRLVVPCHLAYGEEGREPLIPPGADLTFEIELVDVAKYDPEARLLLAPQTRVRWQGSTIGIYVPSETRTVETTDGEVLSILHHFSTPSRRADVLAQFPGLPAEDVEAVVDELEAANILVALPARDTPPARETPDALTVSPDSGKTRLLFVLPPNLNDYGQLDVPCAFSFLASLAEQKGYATDFLLASALTSTRPSPTRAFVGPSHERLPTILFLDRFADELLTRIAGIRAQGEQPILALSCFSSALYASCMILGTLARDRFPDLPILTGGYHPTVDPGSMNAVVGGQMPALQDDQKWRPVAGELFQTLDAATARITARGDFVFDYVFEGRADRSFLEVVDDLARGRRRPGQPRVIPAAPMSDGDIRAFRYQRKVLSRLAAEQASLSTGPMHPFSLCFSLGCPFACSFCINSKTHERWQGMDPGHAIDTLDFLHHSCGINRFSLLDATFAAQKGWRQTFFAELGKKDWIEDIHIDTETSVLTWEMENLDVLDRLSMTVQIGLESCSPAMLLGMEKTPKPEQYLARLKTLIETLAPRIDQLHLMMIFGFPGETRQTLKETLGYLLDECRVLFFGNVEICPQLYLPLLGTRAFEQTDEFAARFGYKPTLGKWWNRDGSDRFRGLRPSRTLSLDICVQLIDTLETYFRGARVDDADEERSESKEQNVCGTLNRSKLEQRQLRAALWRILD